MMKSDAEHVPSVGTEAESTQKPELKLHVRRIRVTTAVKGGPQTEPVTITWKTLV